jgi:hypothetical protein
MSSYKKVTEELQKSYRRVTEELQEMVTAADCRLPTADC